MREQRNTNLLRHPYFALLAGSVSDDGTQEKRKTGEQGTLPPIIKGKRCNDASGNGLPVNNEH